VENKRKVLDPIKPPDNTTKKKIRDAIKKASKNRGGAREGAGRKKVSVDQRRITTSVTLPRWMVKELDKLGNNRTLLIEQAVLKTYNLKPTADQYDHKFEGKYIQ